MSEMDFELRDRVAAPLDDVEAALLSPDFFARLGDLPNIAAPELLDQQEDGTAVVRRVRYRFTGEVSGAVRRVVDPDKLSWVDECRYDRAAHRATHRILPDQYEKLLRCNYEEILEADGSECVRGAIGELAVKVPLVGGRVERAIVDGLRERASAEAEVLAELAAGT
ncbi:MAG: DUF2505 family protein [Acidimicrobiia bacterium]